MLAYSVTSVEASKAFRVEPSNCHNTPAEVPFEEMTGECPAATFFDCASGTFPRTPFVSAIAVIGEPFAEV